MFKAKSRRRVWEDVCMQCLWMSCQNLLAPKQWGTKIERLSMTLYIHTCYMVSIWLWGSCMCSFCASLFMECGRTQNNLWALIQNLQLFIETWASLSVLFYIPAFSCSQGCRWPVQEAYIITLFCGGEPVLFNCHHGNVLFNTLFWFCTKKLSLPE